MIRIEGEKAGGRRDEKSPVSPESKDGEAIEVVSSMLGSISCLASCTEVALGITSQTHLTSLLDSLHPLAPLGH